MGRRRRSGPLEDLFGIAALLPWWVAVLLAAAAYFGFHMIAVSPPPPTTSGHIANFAGHALWKGLATALQYVAPLILFGGAAASAIKRRTSAGRTSDLEGGADAAPAGTARGAAPAEAPGEDLYELRKASPGAKVSRADKWTLELLRAIDWKRFEEVCAEYFRVRGFHATTKSHGPDGGIDVIVYSPQDKSAVVNVVQCKQWKKQVGPKALRELLGVMTDMKVARGTFVTSSTFNDEARRIAVENRIHLIDGQGFLEQILKRSPADQQKLLAVATEGDYLTPSCPSCGTKLLRRENKKDRSWFWGCSNYPRCRYKLNAAS